MRTNGFLLIADITAVVVTPSASSWCQVPQETQTAEVACVVRGMNNKGRQEETIFEAARQIGDPTQRQVYLQAACARDPAMRTGHKSTLLLWSSRA